jgi:hypothetical protein
MATLIITSGLPFSKRDSYVRNLDKSYTIISREVSRGHLFGYDRETSTAREVEITRDMKFRLGKAYLSGLDICYNSTNCMGCFIDKLIAECPAEYEIRVKFFDCSIYRAIIGNILQWLKNSKWIPIDVLLALKGGYDTIDKDKYRVFNNELSIVQKHW